MAEAVTRQSLNRRLIARKNGTARSTRLAVAGGLLGALGVLSSCCLLPLALLGVGVSGTWIGNLTALAPYKPIFGAIALPFLGYGYYCAYRRPKGCAPDEACAQPRSHRLAKVGLWIATALFVVGLAFDAYIEPLLVGS
jgi:mercuric ion transport protein